MSWKIAVLPGDGIGPEVMEQAILMLKSIQVPCELEYALIGGAAYDQTGNPLPNSTLELCKSADAILLGAVGGPKWDQLEPRELRPEVGALLPLRSELNLYANLRPAKTYSALEEASPIKASHNIDLMIVRELTGGIYFGKPRERTDLGTKAIDTSIYTQHEIERIAHRAFEIARQRKKNVLSVDKANVLETSRLWRETVSTVSNQYPEVELNHMYVDNCAMQLIQNPSQFDTILTENLFGDILSDEAAMITGSIGLLPSASLSDKKGDRVFGMYEPVHGSAPDLAGSGKANPIATILSAAMMLQYTFGDQELAARIEKAVNKALEDGLRTSDIHTPKTKCLTTAEMGEAILKRL